MIKIVYLVDRYESEGAPAGPVIETGTLLQDVLAQVTDDVYVVYNTAPPIMIKRSARR